MKKIILLSCMIIPLTSVKAFVPELDVIYDQVNGVNLKMDVYRPSVPSLSMRPALVWTHGGCFNSGGKNDLPDYVKKMADEGFTVFSVGYRLSTVAKYPAAVTDVQQSIRFIRKNASRFQVDAKKIVTHGESAGGYLASVPGLRPLPSRSGQIDQYSERVQLVSDWYGRADFTLPQASGTDCAASFLGLARNAKNEAAFKEASLTPYVDKNSAPFFIIHGTQDTQVYPVHSTALANALWNNNKSAELTLVEKTGHAFMGGIPWDLTRKHILAFFKMPDNKKAQMHSSFARKSLNAGFLGNAKVERFTKDQYFSGGFSFNYKHLNTPTLNTELGDLYLNVRAGANFQYTIPNPSGVYKVGLFFAEKNEFVDRVGDRKFDVVLNFPNSSTNILPNLDLYKIAGKDVAIRRFVNVISKGGEISLGFKGSKESKANVNAIISGLEIEEVAY